MSMVSEALRDEETRAGGRRTVVGVVNSIETLEGGGFLVRRPFPKASFSEFDPFLLLDEMGPMKLAPGQAKGAPDHPHCGFETVTYLLSGEMEHKDSQGHAGRLTRLSQLRHVETKNPLFFNGSSQKVCTTFARLFLQ
jgi:pirin-like protein